MRRRQDCRAAHRGFTMLEVSIALGLLFLGLLGMGALSAAAIRTNMEAQDRTAANNLLNRVLEELQVEALNWNDPAWRPATESENQVEFLPALRALPLDTTGETVWLDYGQRFTEAGARRAYTHDLRPVNPRTDPELAKFCVHYKLTWLNPNESARADVRVYWLRRGADQSNWSFHNTCGIGGMPNIADDNIDIRCAAGAIHLMRNAQGDRI